MNLGWHFMRSENGWPVLRDGRLPPPVGKPLRHEGKVGMCASGLHASREALDALRYAPGSYCARVSFSEPVEVEEDKVVSRSRTILWLVDAETVLREFARWCALTVIDRWNAPDVVRQWLETGDESLKNAARAAAESAALSAAESAAESAALSAAKSATKSAARAAAKSAALSATKSAPWPAAKSAARDTVWSAQNEQLKGMLHRAQLIAGAR